MRNKMFMVHVNNEYYGPFQTEEEAADWALANIEVIGSDISIETIYKPF